METLTSGRPKDWGMRIPDQVLDCVCFFCVTTVSDGVAREAVGGTGFFVNVAGRRNQTHYLYLVTAAHVVKDLQGFEEPYIRFMDARSGKLERAPLVGEWVYHPEADVAVMFVEQYPEWSSPPWRRPLPIGDRVFLTPQKAERYHVGIGDDLTVVGLYRRRPGGGTNVPVVRHGIISAMPGEPIEGNPGEAPFVAYLAELRSTGGLSGSPVFVNLFLGRNADGSYNECGSLALMGLIRGHFEVPRPSQRGKKDRLDLTEDEKDLLAVNIGIAMVTPIGYVAEVLHGEKFTRARSEGDANMKHDEKTTSDSRFPPPADRDEAGPPGPEPEMLAIDLPMDEAVKKMFEAGKPPRD